MTGKTHIAAGICTASIAAVTYYKMPLNSDSVANLVMYSSIGALLPDIDHAKSTLGSKMPALSKIFSHRGFTHTLWFIAFTWLILSYFNFLNISQININFLIIGMVSHLICDAMTPMGIQPFKVPGTSDNHLFFNFKIPFVNYICRYNFVEAIFALSFSIITAILFIKF